MLKSVHERATEVIGKVIDLDRVEAKNRIELECVNDPELKEAVLELYNGIFGYEVPEEESFTTEEIKSSIKDVKGLDKSTTLVFQRWAQKIFENRKIRLLFLSLSLLLLLIIGISIRFQVRRLLINDIAQHLEDQLFTQYIRMQEWIDNGKSNIEALATDPEIIKIAEECNRLQKLDPTLTLLNNKEQRNKFYRQYRLSQSYLNSPTGIISKEGARVLIALNRYKSNDSIAGIRLGKGVYSSYLEAMNKTVFVKPLSEEETIYNLPDTSNAWVSCYFFSPIKNEDGELIGILYNSYLAKGEFSKILSRVHFGNRGESYAFDKKGRMLSSGRFLDELKNSSYYALAKNDETIYNIILKDPGGKISKTYLPKLEKSQMPFIAPIQKLHVELDKGIVDSIIVGNSNDSYRNYRGEKVISRWIWLPKYDFGIITEVTLEEAISTLKFFDFAFLILYVIIFGLSYLLFKSNIKIFRFGKKIQDFKQLGQYKLIDKIGEGGFGEVYKAEHAFLKTPVAIKLLKKRFNGTDMLDRFEKEVKVTSSLSNPNTVRVYDYGNTSDGQFYYVMEYLNGISLDHLVQKEKEIEVGRGIHILLSVCFSLQEAHSQGLIHRDIKPGNIMICSMGGANDVVKVLDFGLVKSIDTDIAQQTQVNRIGGTPMFMAPERLRDPFNTDQRVDLYSIGALGVYMFSGKYLLELISQKMLAGDKTIQADFKTQLIDSPDVPAELKDLLTQCLSFDADKRPANVGELIDRLESLQVKYPWSRYDARKWWQEYDVYA